MNCDFKQREHEILSGIDIHAELSPHVKFTRNEPNSGGWLECHAIGRDDSSASAAVNVAGGNGELGRYKDQGSGESLSFWDLTAKLGIFKDWKASRKHYAEKTGVQLSKPRAQKKRRSVAEQIADSICPELHDTLIGAYCNGSPPITPEAVKAAGGMVCTWPATSLPAYRFRCIGFRAYRGDTLAGIILRRVDGDVFPASDDGALKERKTHCVGGTEDGWVIVGGRQAAESAVTIWKVEGVPDSLTLYQHLPAGHAVITNICGAAARPADLPAVYAGKRLIVVGDTDDAGKDGAKRFAEHGAAFATDVRIAVLPFDHTPNHGKDVRDFFNQGGTFEHLATIASESAQVTPSPAAVAAAKVAAEKKTESHGLPVIRIDPAAIPVHVVMARITDHLLDQKYFYCRAGLPVMVQGDGITTIDNPAMLGGLLNSFVEFVVVSGSGDNLRENYEPLPGRYAQTWIYHPVEKSRLPEIKMFTRNPVFSGDDLLVSPGYDLTSGIYFAGQQIIPGNGMDRLNLLISEFCFRRPSDRVNYLGILLTIVMMPRFIGCKPGVLFNGNQPELGKSILAQIVAILRDGHPVETCSYHERDEEFEKRIGSRVRSGVTTIIIDNAKGGDRKRRLVIDSACLERSITDAILSFRLLGTSSDIRCENSHMFCITANGAEASRDLVTRCVPVNLFFEGDPCRRKFKMTDAEGYAIEHRSELLSELLGMVERWKSAGKPLASVNTRFNKRGWGNIIGGILAANGETGFLDNLDDAATEFDPIARDVGEMVARMAESPGTVWTGAELTALALGKRLLVDDIGTGSERSQSTRMGIILSRFIGKAIAISREVDATLIRDDGRNATEYGVKLATRESKGTEATQNAMF